MNINIDKTISMDSSTVLWVFFFIFLVLKLTGTIDWSWWWVTCPLWIGFALFAIFMLFCLLGIGAALFFKRKLK